MKSYGFLSFAKNIGENISKILSGKYGQKLLDHAKQSATDAFKTSSKGAIQKTVEATGYLIENKIADIVSKTSPKNNLETDEERLKEKFYISRIKTKRYWSSKVNGRSI